MAGKAGKYPDDCVQSVIQPDDWWIDNSNKVLCRGALVFAFVPHVDQVPYTFGPVGRTEATRHDSARIQVAPLRIHQPPKKTDLPVAAMPLYSGEVWTAYRAKKRPCLVVGSPGPLVDTAVTRGMASHSTAPTILAAPYYGVTRDGARGGYNPAFVERVRHCDYPQFLWDQLPVTGGPGESILRLDHLQPIGTHHNSYQLSEYKLSVSAIEVLDELLRLLIWGEIPEDSLTAMYREQIRSTFRD